MYNAEVLSKFPVVQHFPFGSLFSWDHDPNAVLPPTTAHSTSGPQSRPVAPDAGTPSVAAARPMPGVGTQAPWAKPGAGTQAGPAMGSTAAPWAGTRREAVPTSRPGGATGALPALPDTSRMPPGPMAPTRAPWSAQTRPSPSQDGNADVPTKAPWAK
jgi:serine/threonine-protein phosphatase 2A activator